MSDEGKKDMSSLGYYYDADSTSYLLANADQANDEGKLVKTLSRLYDQVYRIETTVGPSRRTEALRQQIAQLELRLKNLRHPQSGNEAD